MRRTHRAGWHFDRLWNFVSAVQERLRETDEPLFAPPDVFDEHEGRPALSDDPRDVRKEVDGDLSTPGGSAEWLAWGPSSDCIHDLTPRSRLEGDKVRVYRSGVKQPFLHSLRQTRGEIGVPFHVADGAGTRDSESDSEVETPNPGT